MIPIENFDIRYSTLDDNIYLQEWFQDPAALDDFPFGMREKEEALKNWIGFSKYKASLTGMIADRPVAIGTLLLMPYRKVAHHCSFYLIVDPAHRRKGIGTSMVKNLLHLARSRFRLEQVHVELYEPSLIYPILIKLGFHQFVRQEHFIRVNGEPRPRLLLEYEFT
jgi:putative acetyltransferase